MQAIPPEPKGRQGAPGIVPWGRSPAIKVAVASLILYHAIGFFPFAAVEGDDITIAAGAHRLGEDLRHTYTYPFQPGIHELTHLVARMAQIDELAALCLLSAVSSIACVLLAPAVFARFVPVEAAVMALIMTLLPETMSSGSFGNGTVVSAAIWMASLLVMRRVGVIPGILAGAVFGIALWTRFDAIGMAPSAALLFLDTDFRTGARRAMGWALGVAVTYVGLMGWSRANMGFLLGFYSASTSARSAAGDHLALVSLVAFLPVVSLYLTCIGLARFVWRRDRTALLVGLGVPLPFIVVGIKAAASPKHLYWLLPFVAMLVASGIEGLREARGHYRRLGFAVAVTLLLGQYLFGVQADGGFFSLTVEPRLASTPLSVQVPGPLTSRSRTWRLIVGPSGYLGTADSYRPLTGTLFAPAIWLRRKLVLNWQVRQVADWLDQPGAKGLLVDGRSWWAMQVAMYLIVELQYECPEWTWRDPSNEPTASLWRRGSDSIDLRGLPQGVRPIVGPALFPPSQRVLAILGKSSDADPIVAEWRAVAVSEDPDILVSAWEVRPRTLRSLR